MSKLMVVAHPDDESIFGGSLLLKHSNWKVICVTNGDNKIRSKEFKKAMKFVGAKHEIWDYPDKWNGGFDQERLKKDLLRELRKKKWSHVVTHGLDGEYGHTQHKVLSKVMHQIVPKNLYTFALTQKKLDPQTLEKKRKLLKYYKSQDISAWENYILYEGINSSKKKHS